MNPRQRERVEHAFAAALAASEEAASSPSRRAGIELTALCEGDEDVRREVQSLLGHLQAAGSNDSSGTRFLDPAELHADRGSSFELAQDALLQEWGGEAIGRAPADGAAVVLLLRAGVGILAELDLGNRHQTRQGHPHGAADDALF